MVPFGKVYEYKSLEKIPILRQVNPKKNIIPKIQAPYSMMRASARCMADLSNELSQESYIGNTDKVQLTGMVRSMNEY